MSGTLQDADAVGQTKGCGPDKPGPHAGRVGQPGGQKKNNNDLTQLNPDEV